MLVNIKDIARIAGVGISTVSRVINNSGSVSDATRKKVTETINANHYVPNNSARNLKITQSKNIALIVKDISNPFFNKMIQVIEPRIALQGYPLMIQNVDASADELDIAIQEARDRNLCGVIIMGGCYSYSEERFRHLSIPCVLLTVSARPDVDPALYSSITIDDEQEGCRATEYLIGLGHRRIGFIYSALEPVTPNTLRFLGYQRALKEHDIPFDPNLVANSMNIRESGYTTGFRAMKQLYSKNRDMTAVFAFADILAIGAAKAVLSMGLSIPDDISIVGFDGIEMAEYYHPSLDTMYQPAAEMALSATNTLFDMIQGNSSKHIVYESVLLKRGSCRKLL
ncbi:LacI family transcriptional regulator [Spirochaetia bacterium]|nr:LacI family transcriptional regulator [Spirochaetia bacterium]